MNILVTPDAEFANDFEAMHEVWDESFFVADEALVAVGYSSHEALLYLARLVELNPTRRLSVCIGLARFEGLTRQQKEAACALDSRLRSEGRGGVVLAHQLPFHGKLTVFVQSESGVRAILGSSNLGGLVPPRSKSDRRSVEIDVAIDDAVSVGVLHKLITELIDDLSVPLKSIVDLVPTIGNSNIELDGRDDVMIAEAREMQSIYDERHRLTFNIPLKTERKSNLNTYFGKGREDKQGNVRPRNWYEVELIVPKGTTSHPDYPRGDFVVCTDDGYIFACKSSGAFHKNFRSRDDLTVLGRWIKGRLEAEGCLSVGEPVTAEVLQAYGRSSLALSKTGTEREFAGEWLPLWTLDFSIG